QEPVTEKSARKQAKEEVKTQKKAAKTLEKATQTKYMVMGLNGRYGLIQDFRMSGLTYQGTGPGLILAYRMRSPKVWEEFVVDPSVSFQTSNNEQALLYNPYIGMSYRYLRHLTDLGSKQDWHLYLGGELEGRGNVRILSELGNSAAHWEGIGALNLAAAIQKDVKLPLIKTPVSMDYQLMLPVFAYVNRGPSYSLSGLDPQNHVFTSINGLSRVNSELGLSFPFSKNNPNKLRVAYRWDFYGFNDNEIHPVRSAQHGLAVELLVNLSKQ
ncbi:MAG: hypothetical protein AB8H47_18630, partial [Bacteroidia bacterium]